MITSYTLPEAEDDAEVLEEVLFGAENDEYVPINEMCLWGAEINPFASRIVRETKSSNNTYYENGAWQAYLMGISSQ